MTSPGGTRTIKLKLDGDASGVITLGRQGERALLGVDQQVDKTARGATKLDRSFGTASRSVLRDLERMEKEAWESGNGMDKAFTTSVRSMREEIQRLSAEGRRTGATLDSQLGGALRNVKKQADDLRDSMNDGDGGGGFLDDLLGDFATGKGAATAAGAGIGALLWKGLQNEWAENKVGGLIAAQTGAAEGSAGKLGDVAGDAFTDQFADSVEEAGAAVTSLFQNKLADTSTPEAALERLTKRVLVLSQTTGEEANEISRATRQMLVTDLAGNVSEAQDIIQQATEKGLNSAGDLFDTLTEYGTSFRVLGLKGPEALGLVSQAMDAGARDTDQAADALKEFGIRAQDMSVTSRRGFQTLGLDAESMGRRIAAGGDSAKAALQDTLNRLRDMPPSVERSQAAVDLFGAKAEDLGEALYNMDLDDAAVQFGDFAGSVLDASARISEGQSGWDKFGRGIGIVTDKIGEFFSFLGDGEVSTNPMKELLFGMAEAKDRFLESGDTSGLDEIVAKYPEMSAVVKQFIADNRGQVESTKELNDETRDYIGTLDEYISKKREAADGVMGLAEASAGWYESLDAATAAIAENGATLDQTTEKGRNNQRALFDVADSALSVAEAMTTQGKSVDEVNAYLTTAQGQFVATARQMGLGEQAALDLARQLGLIPANVGTTYNFKMGVNTPAGLQSVLSAMDRIRANPVLSQDYYLYTHAVQGGGGSIRDYQSSYQGGGGRATGGPVWGGEWYRINERGEEWFKAPNSGGTVIPNREVARSSGDVSVSVFIGGEEFRGMIRQEIRENNRSIKRGATAGTGRSR